MRKGSESSFLQKGLDFIFVWIKTKIQTFGFSSGATGNQGSASTVQSDRPALQRQQIPDLHFQYRRRGLAWVLRWPGLYQCHPGQDLPPLGHRQDLWTQLSPIPGWTTAEEVWREQGSKRKQRRNGIVPAPNPVSERHWHWLVPFVFGVIQREVA